MQTLADVALSCAIQLGRASADGTSIVSLAPQIKAEIGHAIRHYNRKPWHLSENRTVRLNLRRGDPWYSHASVVHRAAGQPKDKQSPLSSHSAAMPFDGLGQRVLIPILDILSIDYIRDPGGAFSDHLRQIDFETFQRFQSDTSPAGPPTHYTRYAGQIGVYPTPSQDMVLEVSGMVRPTVPAADGDNSVWFEEAGELIEAAACARVCLKHLRDPQRASEFQPIVQGTEAALHAEYVRQSRTGRLVAHD